VNRSTLTAFLTALVVIIGFSAAAGAVSLFWKPPSERDRAGANAKSRREGNNTRESNTASDSNNSSEDEDDFDSGNARRDGSRHYKNGTLHGQVTDSHTGDAVEGAAVSLDWFSSDEDGASTETAPQKTRFIRIGDPNAKNVKTDINGRYSIEIPPSVGQVYIRFEKANFFAARKWVGFKGDATLDVDLGRAGWISGKVTDVAGAPITKFHITAKAAGWLGMNSSTVSRAFEGSESFKMPLTVGTWEVTVYGDQGRFAPKTTKLSMGREDMNLDFTLSAAKGASEGGAGERR
jgi:hypothetical protein